MNIDVENYLESVFRQNFSHETYSACDDKIRSLYASSSFPHQGLREMLTILHCEIVDLCKTMNERLPTGETSAHFWAEPSRALLKVIEVIRDLENNLRETKYAFTIDEYYETIISDCSKWLSSSGGSSIPPGREKVTLYFIKPIFLPSNNVISFGESALLSNDGEFIDQGGFGSVYKFHHPIIDLDFAVKFFEPQFVSDEDRIINEKRFFREASMLFKLNHPNIVRIYDVGRKNGNPYIKMEYVNGTTLEKVRTDRGNFTYDAASRAMKQVLAGLEHAHKIGIIHRDLKPSNIMVEKTGKKWTCKIIDFGISAFINADRYSKLTRTGEHIAGGSYIDPLLFDDPQMRDARSDIYSVGAIMYFLLCGKAPTGGDPEAYLRESNSNLTEVQIGKIMKSLSMKIENRYKDCEEMIKAIDDFNV
ncbi:MAG: serine/threonine protein kinase [Clostridia bacterium]|nr:serine/threonine protein kinase [Clostridia bacterium]